MDQQQTKTLFPQISKLTDRTLGLAFKLAEERNPGLLLGECGLGPDLHDAYLAEVWDEIERRRKERSIGQ